MGHEEALRRISLPVAASEATNQYRFVVMGSGGQVDTVQSAGASADGVLQDNPNTTGFAGQVGIGGVSKVVYGGTVAAGDRLTSDNVGRAVTATSGQFVNAKALVAGVLGDVQGVLLRDGQAKV